MKRRAISCYTATILTVTVLTGLLTSGTPGEGRSLSARDAGSLSPRILCNRLVPGGVPDTSLPEIWTVDYSGGSKNMIKPFAAFPCNGMNPVYAPNGSWMAFEALDEDPLYKSTAIYVAGFDGSAPGQVTPSMDLSQ